MRTYSTNALALEFGIDRAKATRAIHDHVAEPDAEEVKGRPTYSTATFARALENYNLSNSSNNDSALNADVGGGDTGALLAARIRSTNASAVAKERENALASGLYCLKEEAAKAYAGLMTTANEILLGTPGTIADALSTHCDEDRNACEQIVRRKINDALAALADPDTYQSMPVGDGADGGA